MQTCQPNGTFSSCPCNASGGGQGGAASGMGQAPGGSDGSQATNAGMSAPAQGGRGGTGTAMAGMGPAGRGGADGGGAGRSGAGGAPMTAGSGGASGADEFAAERQACVDTINMHRATLSLPPLMRGTPEQESCSDMGAKKDGDSGQAHGSAGDCAGLGAQNTCPGYPLRGTLTATLNGCLQQMWDEGEPAEGVQACIADISGCFQMHGHWINMTSMTSRRVACGFYKMANGRYWMNQNFGR